MTHQVNIYPKHYTAYLSDPVLSFFVSLLFSLLPVSGANSVCFPGFVNCSDLKALAVLP